MNNQLITTTQTNQFVRRQGRECSQRSRRSGRQGSLPLLSPVAYAQSAYKEFGFQRVWLKQTLNCQGWEFSCPYKFYRESPGKFDSRTLSRETLSRWTGRRALHVRARAQNVAISYFDAEAQIRNMICRKLSLSLYIYIYIYIYLFIIHTYTHTGAFRPARQSPPPGGRRWRTALGGGRVVTPSPLIRDWVLLSP